MKVNKKRTVKNRNFSTAQGIGDIPNTPIFSISHSLKN